MSIYAQDVLKCLYCQHTRFWNKAIMSPVWKHSEWWSEAGDVLGVCHSPVTYRRRNHSFCKDVFTYQTALTLFVSLSFIRLGKKKLEKIFFFFFFVTAITCFDCREESCKAGLLNFGATNINFVLIRWVGLLSFTLWPTFYITIWWIEVKWSGL